MTRRRHGFSLIEAIATIVVLGIIASVATLAMRPLPSPGEDPASIIADSVPVVLRRGQPMTLVFAVDGRPVAATINIDGSVIADSALRIDRLTGRLHDAR